jgi:hypothetical protein
MSSSTETNTDSAMRAITVRKARIFGWWVDGRWCPTQKIREHEITRLRKAAGAQLPIRTPQ